MCIRDRHIEIEKDEKRGAEASLETPYKMSLFLGKEFSDEAAQVNYLLKLTQKAKEAKDITDYLDHSERKEIAKTIGGKTYGNTSKADQAVKSAARLIAKRLLDIDEVKAAFCPEVVSDLRFEFTLSRAEQSQLESWATEILKEIRMLPTGMPYLELKKNNKATKRPMLSDIRSSNFPYLSYGFDMSDWYDWLAVGMQFRIQPKDLADYVSQLSTLSALVAESPRTWWIDELLPQQAA